MNPADEADLDWNDLGMVDVLTNDLDQDQVWITATGEVVRLDQMSARHAGNVLRFLWNSAEDIAEREQMRNTLLVDRLRRIVRPNQSAL